MQNNSTHELSQMAIEIDNNKQMMQNISVTFA